MKESLLKSLWDEYNILTAGMIPDSIKQRGRERVMHRAAFAVSMRSLFTCEGIAAVINVDHSTIIHYEKNHEVYERYSDEYNKFMGIVEKIKPKHSYDKTELLFILQEKKRKLERLQKEIAKEIEAIEQQYACTV